jgi:hypothetical protein
VPNTPVFLLAFANNRRVYLRDLPAERKAILKALSPAVHKKKVHVVDLPNATPEEVYDALLGERRDDRICLFHFGGHAGGASLMFETATGEPAPAHAEGLAALLGRRAVRLVFLNGCATQNQAAELLGAGVGSVIVSSEAIDDRVAASFAARFYQGIAAGRTIRRAFDDASATMKSSCGSVRGAYASRSFVPSADGEAGWPWRLYPGQMGDSRLVFRWRPLARALAIVTAIIVLVILTVLANIPSPVPCSEVEVTGFEVELNSGKTLRRGDKSVTLSWNDLQDSKLIGRALLNPDVSRDSCSCEWSVRDWSAGVAKDVTDGEGPCGFIISPHQEHFPLDLMLQLDGSRSYLFTVHRSP